MHRKYIIIHNICPVVLNLWHYVLKSKISTATRSDNVNRYSMKQVFSMKQVPTILLNIADQIMTNNMQNRYNIPALRDWNVQLQALQS